MNLRHLEQVLLFGGVILIVLELLAGAWMLDVFAELTDRIATLEQVEAPVDPPAVDREARDLFEHLEPRVLRLEQDSTEIAFSLDWATRITQAVRGLLDLHTEPQS